MNKGSTLASLLGLLLAAAGAVAEPVPLAAVNTEWIEQDPWLSPDGYTMYFSSNRSGGDFNIFEAQWDGRAWSAPVRLSGLINSDFDETQPSVSGDGQWLLFISHRGRFWRGPWRAKRQRDGSWGKAVFVDPVIQNATYRAVIGPDGQTVCFQSRARQRAGKPPKLDLCMTYDSGTGFWTEPRPHNGEPPGNEVPGARWRFSTRNGDIYYEPTGASDPHRSDALEVFNALRASSRYGRGDEDYWMSEAQNLIDGLDDTSWISKAGEPLDRQWVLLALNGPSRYIPGLSRIHSLRIHTGPVEPITIEEGKGTDRVVPDPAHRGTCPARVRILGGMNLDAMKELAAVKLTSHAGSPWCEVRLNEPSYLRYLEVQVVEAADPGAAYVALNEVQAYGAGLSVPRPVHHVTTDENNNITIDGKPFFPIYIYNAKADPDLAKWGFNTALQTYDVHADMARLRILDQAADMGFMVIGHVPWVETDSGRKMARNQLLAMKQHPALLGYLMSDEAGHSEQIMQRDERRAAYIRKYDGNHFSMLNDLYPQNYHRSSRFVDVFSIDPYPHIVGQPYSYQAHAVDKAYECVRRAKPVFVVNASWGRIISPVENRLNVYLALIHGAKGISWYAMGVRWQDLDHWASILRCVREIHRLKPVVFAPQTRPDSPLLTHSRIENPGARIDVMIKQVNGEVWMLAANCEPRLAKVRFSFGWGEEITIREVMADHPQGWSMDRLDHALMDGWPLPKDREPVRAARPIELTFDPHAVRVFRMRPTGKIGAYHEPPGEGTPLAMVNESTLERTVRKVKQLRQEDKQAEAKQVINQFWDRYRDRVSVDDLSALMDSLGEDAGPDETLADYGKLADAYPDADHWPKWVFKIVRSMVDAGRRQDAQEWTDRLIQQRPDSLWRANTEVLVDPASARSARKPYTVAARLGQAPAIDGVLDEPAWQDRVSFRNTVYLDSSKNPQETGFAVAYDDSALYVAVRALEPETSKIVCRVDKDDRSVWADDCIVIYLDAELDYFDYQQFIFNSSGVMWDGRGDRLGHANAGTLNAKVERRARVKHDAWQIEARLPFAELGLEPPKPGQVWGLGLQRWRQIGGALPTVWGNERGTSHDNRPDQFGFLIFE